MVDNVARSALMFDTHAIARSLTDAKLTAEQADGITSAVRQAAEHGDHVTRYRFDAGLATLRADIYRAMLLQAAAIVGAVVAILRMLG